MRCLAVLVLGLVALLNTVSGDDAPTCPQRTPVQNYHCHSFHGTWYVLMRTASNDFEANDICSKLTIEERPNGTISLVNRFVRQGESEYGTLEGNYWRTEEEGTEGMFWVSYPEKHPDWSSKYYVIGTDYTDFAVTSSCWVGRGGTIRDHAWVLGRHPELTDAIRQKAAEATQNNHLDLDAFHVVSHANCPTDN